MFQAFVRILLIVNLPWIKLSWHYCSMWDKRRWLNWFWQFLCERLSFFNPKGFYYWYAWSHSLWNSRNLSQENSADSYLSFWLALLHSVSYFFSSINHLCLCARLLILFCLTDEVLSINPSANVFVFVDFNVHHKDWLTYSSGTDRSGKLL